MQNYLYYGLIIIFSVLIHELGHLLSALLFKLDVKAFSFGFGKIIWHKKWKNIDWRLSLIPFGGYCDIEESLTKSNSLSTIAYWKQVIVLLSGVFLNLLLAFICYLIQFQSIQKGLWLDFVILKYIFLKNYDIIYGITVIYKINSYLLQISLLNLMLFITNLLPIPALDGGYLWLLPIRRKIPRKLFDKIIKTSFKWLMILQIFMIIYWWIL